jgi:hypothetical protein
LATLPAITVILVTSHIGLPIGFFLNGHLNVVKTSLA